MIRIIGGEYKGRYLKVPNSKVTRPTMDKVRQAMFNALKNHVEGSVCLDLFAGSGAMGLEALSRGARKCYFVEKDRGTFQVLKENVLSLGIEKDAFSLFFGDFRLFLKKLKEEKIDLLFLDPPYRFNINADIIQDMDKKGKLSLKAIIVSEQDYPNPEIEGFERKEYRYGAKYVALYERKEASEL